MALRLAPDDFINRCLDIWEADRSQIDRIEVTLMQFEYYINTELLKQSEGFKIDPIYLKNVLNNRYGSENDLFTLTFYVIDLKSIREKKAKKND